jgi:hypothetical protein
MLQIEWVGQRKIVPHVNLIIAICDFGAIYLIVIFVIIIGLHFLVDW